MDCTSTSDSAIVRNLSNTVTTNLRLSQLTAGYPSSYQNKDVAYSSFASARPIDASAETGAHQVADGIPEGVAGGAALSEVERARPVRGARGETVPERGLARGGVAAGVARVKRHRAHVHVHVAEVQPPPELCGGVVVLRPTRTPTNIEMEIALTKETPLKTSESAVCVCV